MVNVLKEIGIQQWRRRTTESTSTALASEPFHVDVNQELTSFGVFQDEKTEFEEPINVTSRGNTAAETAHIPQSMPPIGASSQVSGFSGSLKQALKKPDDTEVDFDRPVASATESINFLPTAESADLSEPIDTVKSNVELTTEPIKKAVVPLNLSNLIDTEESESAAKNQHFDAVTKDAPLVSEAVGVEKTAKLEEGKSVSWDDLSDRLKTNEHCPSCGWGNAFLGSGNQQADWFFIVDAPNMKDIEAKSIFCGRAGQLFDAMLAAVGLDRERVYVSSVFKCAPTDDLSVTPQCDSVIWQQIQLVAPKVIVTFGEFAAQAVIKSNLGLNDLRSSDHSLADSSARIIPTFSPIQMLNDTSLKAFAWQDLKKSLNVTVT